jgi:hypothetical protein
MFKANYFNPVGTGCKKNLNFPTVFLKTPKKSSQISSKNSTESPGQNPPLLALTLSLNIHSNTLQRQSSQVKKSKHLSPSIVQGKQIELMTKDHGG